MKALNQFILKMESMSREEIVYGSLKLLTPKFVTKHNEFEHMINWGEIVSVPKTYTEGIAEVGDTMWVHHNISINKDTGMSIGDATRERDPFILDSEQNLYHIPYTPIGRDNLCYLIRKKDGSYHTVGDVLFCIPNDDRSRKREVGGLILPPERDKNIECEVLYDNKLLNDNGVFSGDIVGVADNSDYTLNIDGKELWRMFNFDINYIVRDGNMMAFDKRVIIETYPDETHYPSGLEIPLSLRIPNRRAKVLSAGKNSGFQDGEDVYMLKYGKKQPLSSSYDNRLFVMTDDGIIPDYIMSQLEGWDAGRI